MEMDKLASRRRRPTSRSWKRTSSGCGRRGPGRTVLTIAEIHPSIDQGPTMDLAIARNSLPPCLEARWQKIRQVMETHRELLAEQGSLARGTARGKTIWMLRFVERSADGGAVQRGIYLGGDPEILRRTRALLRECRAARERAREAVQLARGVALARSAVRWMERHGQRSGR